MKSYLTTNDKIIPAEWNTVIILPIVSVWSKCREITWTCIPGKALIRILEKMCRENLEITLEHRFWRGGNTRDPEYIPTLFFFKLLHDPRSRWPLDKKIPKRSETMTKTEKCKRAKTSTSSRQLTTHYGSVWSSTVPKLERG